ncbi:zinc finger, CCHC-type containing protein [Tanacetum coccineum]
MKVDGTIEKFKARLVIQGFKQKSGIDYFDTYAPVARISTIRLLIALASIHSLIIHQMDVKTALLNGDLDNEVNMNQPQGFIMPGNENKVCKLIKSLYGLKQAPKQWHQKFDKVVLSNGYSLNQADKCVYRKFDESGKGVIICLYVDDTQLLEYMNVHDIDASASSASSMGKMLVCKHEKNRCYFSAWNPRTQYSQAPDDKKLWSIMLKIGIVWFGGEADSENFDKDKSMKKAFGLLHGLGGKLIHLMHTTMVLYKVRHEDPSWSTSFKTRRTHKTSSALEAL